GAAYLRTDGGQGAAAPYLLVAADPEVRRIRVLAGRRSYDLDGPVALLRAPWVRAADGGYVTRSADVAVLGRTADGVLVVPSGTPASAATAG
ncbi:hypothetical protein ACVU7I_16070, partial [Patulibacter sp. S7RM1-6]